MADQGRVIIPGTGPRAGQKIPVSDEADKKARIAGNEDNSDDPKPEHVKGFLSGLRGMLGLSGKEPSQNGQTVDQAVDEAVKGAPGNNADY